MSRKFIMSLSKREGFVIEASCPDISPPPPSPSRQQEQPVGRGPDFLSDGIVPGARNERNLPRLEMASATSLASYLQSPSPTNWPGTVFHRWACCLHTLASVEVLLWKKKKKKKTFEPTLESHGSFSVFLCAVEEELGVHFNLWLHLYESVWPASGCVFHV